MKEIKKEDIQKIFNGGPEFDIILQKGNEPTENYSEIKIKEILLSIFKKETEVLEVNRDLIPASDDELYSITGYHNGEYFKIIFKGLQPIFFKTPGLEWWKSAVLEGSIINPGKLGNIEIK